MQYASFTVDGDLYGVPVLIVEEFFRPLVVTPVPLTDPRLEGLIHHRGKTASVLDLRRCLQKPPRPAGASSKMVLLETNAEMTTEAREAGLASFDQPVVLHVDATHRIFPVQAEEIHPKPAHVPHDFVKGVVRGEDAYLTLLSIPQLIANILQTEGA